MQANVPQDHLAEFGTVALVGRKARMLVTKGARAYPFALARRCAVDAQHFGGILHLTSIWVTARARSQFDLARVQFSP